MSKAEVAQVLERYPAREAALIPVLHLACREFGHLSEELLEYVADLLAVPQARVYGVATFYSMFRRGPAGKHLIQVCRSVSCSLVGAEQIIDHLKKRLGIGLEETTADKRFTLSSVECLGACDKAPAMLIDDELYGNLTIPKVSQILDELGGASPAEARGAPQYG